MIVTATEFKTNMGRYLDIIGQEDVIITKNGRKIAKLTSIGNDAPSLTESLRGVIKGTDISRESIREERLARYNEDNG